MRNNSGRLRSTRWRKPSENVNRTTSAVEELTFKQYANEMHIAKAEIDSHQFDRAAQRLREIEPDFRDWEWGYLAAQCTPAAIELETRCSFSVSHGSDWLAYGPTGEKGVVILELDTMREIHRFVPKDGSEVKFIVGFSHDDKWLITGEHNAFRSNDHRVRIWDTKSGQLHRVIESDQRILTSSVSKTESKLVVSFGKMLRVYDIPTGRQIEERHFEAFSRGDVLLPHQDRIVRCEGQVRTMDLDGDNVVRVNVVSGRPWHNLEIRGEGATINLHIIVGLTRISLCMMLTRLTYSIP